MGDIVTKLTSRGQGKLFKGDFGGFRRSDDGTTTLVGKSFDKFGGESGDSPEAQQALRAKVLSRGFTAVSAFGDIGQGFQEAARLKSEGRALDFEARQISLQGAREAVNESIRATESIGSQVVASPTSLTGSSAGAILSDFEDTQSSLNIIRLNAEQQSLLSRAAANRARRAAKRAKIAGFVKAASRVGTAFAGGGF